MMNEQEIQNFMRRNPPVTFADAMLIKIYNRLEAIEEKLISEDVTAEDIQDEEEPKKEGKVCQYCNKVHDKPVEYAICAKKNKKEGE